MNDALKSQRIIVTGATGLVGARLVDVLKKSGAHVVRGVRRPARGAGEIYWNADAGEIESGKLEGVDAVVHLAGENIAGDAAFVWIWTAKSSPRRIEPKDLQSALADLERTQTAEATSATSIVFPSD